MIKMEQWSFFTNPNIFASRIVHFKIGLQQYRITFENNDAYDVLFYYYYIFFFKEILRATGTPDLDFW